MKIKKGRIGKTNKAIRYKNELLWFTEVTATFSAESFLALMEEPIPRLTIKYINTLNAKTITSRIIEEFRLGV
jgi:hypothetical protein